MVGVTESVLEEELFVLETVVEVLEIDVDVFKLVAVVRLKSHVSHIRGHSCLEKSSLQSSLETNAQTGASKHTALVVVESRHSPHIFGHSCRVSVSPHSSTS